MYLHFIMVFWEWEVREVSCYFIWNIFFMALCYAWLSICFHELDEIATSPNLEGVILCRSDFTVDYICCMSLVGQIKPKQLCIALVCLGVQTGWVWSRCWSRWSGVHCSSLGGQLDHLDWAFTMLFSWKGNVNNGIGCHSNPREFPQVLQYSCSPPLIWHTPYV